MYRTRLILPLVSPLPNVVIADDTHPLGMKPFRRPYKLTRDWASQYTPLWEKVYAPFKGKPNVAYLEVGCFEGGSIVWMLENILTDPTARVTAIDPFLGSYKDTYYENLALSGAAEKVVTISDYSQRALRGLPWDSFDIIYIDGSHVKESVLEDAVLSWRLLRRGGLLVFDNYRLVEETRVPGIFACPKLAIDPFVQCFDRYFEVIHNSEQVILRRKD